MASKKPLPAARKPLPTTKKPSQEITAGSAGADIAKQKYDILLASMQQRAQLGQFDAKTRGSQRTGIMLTPPPLPTSEQLNSMVDPNRKYQDIAGTMYDQFGRSMNYSNSGQAEALRKLGFTSQSNYDFSNLAYLQSTGRTPVQANQELGQITAGIGSLQQAYQQYPVPSVGQNIPGQQTTPAQQIPSNQQAMQNYQNLLAQGLANYQAQTYPGQSQFGSMARPAQTSPQRKPSTPGFPTPKPFG